MATMSVELVTGERVVYQDSGVELVSAPGSEGTLGILPNHASLISTLDAGEVRIRKGGQEEHFVVFGGFIQVAYNRVIILADTAERVVDIDLERAQRAYQHARERLEQRESPEEMRAAREERQRAELRLRVAQNGRPGSAPRP
jgi:F-type H+-transporting ATPase subunit epsilon